MIEQDRYNIQSGYTDVLLEGVPLNLRYTYNMENGDIEGLGVFVAADWREEYDLHDLVWPRYEDEILAAIEEDANG